VNNTDVESICGQFNKTIKYNDREYARTLWWETGAGRFLDNWVSKNPHDWLTKMNTSTSAYVREALNY
jgi:hypothetical protein